mgnify:CR=1 FL=1
MLLINIKRFKFLFLFFLIVNFSFSQLKAVVIPLFNEEYGVSLLSYIRNAKKSIFMIMFQTGYYSEYAESLSNNILRELVNAKKRGLTVEVILDWSKSGNVKEKNFDTAKFLAENGVSVYFDKESKTTHAKLFVIDGKYVFIGSHNLNYYALEKNNETSVLIESGEVAGVFLNYFNKVKKECKIFLSPVH